MKRAIVRYVILLMLIAGICNLLIGCGTAPKPEPIAVALPVKTPVMTACAVEYPHEPKAESLTVDGGLYSKGTALLRELEAWRTYARELREALAFCADPL